jgi:hypothetical protein
MMVKPEIVHICGLDGMPVHKNFSDKSLLDQVVLELRDRVIWMDDIPVEVKGLERLAGCRPRENPNLDFFPE